LFEILGKFGLDTFNMVVGWLGAEVDGKSGVGTKPVNWNSRGNWQFGKFGLGVIELQENGIRANDH